MQKPIEIITNLFARFKSLGAEFNNVIDIGCYEGSWAKRFKQQYPEANLYLIDASDDKAEQLKQYGTFIQAYLGQHTEQRKFYYNKNNNDSTGNSLYKENSNVPFETKLIETKRLIDVVPQQTYDFIKMDVQGAELEIIEGSLDLFLKTKWIQLECPVFNNNEGAPLFEQIINYMANSGFKVFDIDNVYYNAGLMGVDFVFNNQRLEARLPTEGTKLYYKHV